MGLPPQVDTLSRALREAFGPALDRAVIERTPHGFSARDFPHAPFVIAPAESWVRLRQWNYVETGMCVRFDPSAGCVPREIAELVAQRCRALVGTDGALYAYDHGSRSQHVNAAHASASIARRLRSLGVPLG